MSTRKGLVVGSLALSLARVWSVRQKMSTQSSSATTVVDAIAELLQQHGMETHQMIQDISETADSSVTPGAEGAFVNSLKTVVQSIETQVEKKIKHDQSVTQQKMDLLNHNLYNADKRTSAAKQAADQDDKAYFECVAAEQSKRADADSAEKSMTDSRKNEGEACQRQQDNSGFSLDAPTSKLQIECDMEKGDCDSSLAQLQKDLQKIYQDAQAKLDAKKAAYSKLKTACDTKKQESVKAQSSLDGSESAWNSQKQTCLKLASHREESMCVYGSKLQAKCAAEVEYKHLMAASKKAKGDSYSEVDRQQEWMSTLTTKCLVGKFIQKGLDNTVTAADMNACAAEVNFGRDVGSLNRREKEFAASAASNTCSAGPVSFFNGQTWTVPVGAKPKSSAYVRSPFKPQVSLSGKAFAFCTANSIREGASIHLIVDGECGVNLAAAHSRTVDHIDSSRYHTGASVESWGCDRVAQLKDVELLKSGSKQYLVSHC